MPTCISVNLPAFLTLSLPACLSTCLSVYLNISFLSVCLPGCLHTCLPVCLSALCCLPAICLPACLPASIKIWVSEIISLLIHLNMVFIIGCYLLATACGWHCKECRSEDRLQQVPRPPYTAPNITTFHPSHLSLILHHPTLSHQQSQDTNTSYPALLFIFI